MPIPPAAIERRQFPPPQQERNVFDPNLCRGNINDFFFKKHVVVGTFDYMNREFEFFQRDGIKRTGRPKAFFSFSSLHRRRRPFPPSFGARTTSKVTLLAQSHSWRKKSGKKMCTLPVFFSGDCDDCYEGRLLQRALITTSSCDELKWFPR